MQIKNVAKLTGLSISTIRYYEQLGIIKPEKIGYYKEYTEDFIRQLKQIKVLKEAGLKLKDIQTLFYYDAMEEALFSNDIFIEIKNIIDHTLEEQRKKEQRLLLSKQILLKMKEKIDHALETNK